MVAVDGEGTGTGHWMDTGHRVRRIRERSDPVKSGEFSSRIVGGVAKCALNQRPGAWEVGEVAVDGERLVGSRGVAEVGGQKWAARHRRKGWAGMAVHGAFALSFQCNETVANSPSISSVSMVSWGRYLPPCSPAGKEDKHLEASLLHSQH